MRSGSMNFLESRIEYVLSAMSTKDLYKLSGWAGILAGLINPSHHVISPQGVVGLILMLMWPVLSLFLITGMYLYQKERVGMLGFAGYVINFFGFAFFLVLETIVWIILPFLDESVKEGLLAGPTGLFLRMTAAIVILGVLVFGFATVKARVLSRVGGLLYIIGFIPTILAPFLPLAIHFATHGVIGVALVWLGYSLQRRSHSVDTSR